MELITVTTKTEFAPTLLILSRVPANPATPETESIAQVHQIHLTRTACSHSVDYISHFVINHILHKFVPVGKTKYFAY